MLGQATITSRAGLPVGLAYNPISAAQSEVRKHTLLCHTPAHNQCASVASLYFQNKGQSPAITYRARTWSDPPLLAALPPYSLALHFGSCGLPSVSQVRLFCT